MGNEVNLLKNYPRTKRNTQERALNKTEQDRTIARMFGRDFFDGDRRHGYGGLEYNPRFWGKVVPDIVSNYKLARGCSLLDVGCAKGFLLVDLLSQFPDIEARGVDISEYAISMCHPQVQDILGVACCTQLPFEDKSFDLVISINTIHNLEVEGVKQALLEIMRVSKGNAFITVDAYRNDDEKVAMFDWNLTAKTILHVEDWRALFAEVGYTGDYFWFTP